MNIQNTRNEFCKPTCKTTNTTELLHRVWLEISLCTIGHITLLFNDATRFKRFSDFEQPVMRGIYSSVNVKAKQKQAFFSLAAAIINIFPNNCVPNVNVGIGSAKYC